MNLQSKATTFNQEHPIGSSVNITAIGKRKLTGAAEVVDNDRVLASFTGALNGQYDRGEMPSFPMKVLFNINTIIK